MLKISIRPFPIKKESSTVYKNYISSCAFPHLFETRYFYSLLGAVIEYYFRFKDIKAYALVSDMGLPYLY